MSQLTHAPSRKTHRTRTFFALSLFLIWLIVAGIGGPYFGKISEVSTEDAATFLPSNAESTQVNTYLEKFRDSEEIPAVVVIEHQTSLTQTDVEHLNTATQALPDKVDHVASEISPVFVSETQQAAQIFVPLLPSDHINTTVNSLRSYFQEHSPKNANVYVTGPAGLSADLITAFSGIDGLLLMVALLAVFFILLIVYRSLLLPLMVLFNSIVALSGSILVIWWLAKWEILLLSGQTQGILFILVIGAATDYSLLYVSRYRESLRLLSDKAKATKQAWRSAFEPILASGGTVIAALLCLLLSSLKSNTMLGPVAAIGIIFAMLSSLTLLPSMLFLGGRASFWPFRPVYDPDHIRNEHANETHGIWSQVSAFVKRDHRKIWIITGVFLLIAAAGLTQLRASGVPQSEFVLGNSQARTGQEILAKHFPAGSGTPVYIVGKPENLESLVRKALAHPGIDSLSISTADVPGNSAPITEEGIIPFGPPGTPIPTPTVIDNLILLQATLDVPADSKQALEVVETLRNDISQHNLDALVGGATATTLDTNNASFRDLKLIIPLVLIIILVILMLLLRSVIAPVLLLLTTVLSFAAALGVSAIVFNNIFQFSGADPSVPLFSFVFLVALGIDYNIFLMTRVREEALNLGTRKGILRGLRLTGGVITSAGLVLAATFAALSVIPILFLLQLSFIVAFGVLLDTFIIRSLLVPALCYDIGKTIWWPSHLYKKIPQSQNEIH